MFAHGDGLPPIGLWIMPNNLADGMLENFVEQLIHTPEQQALLAHARSAIGGLPTTLFRPIHSTKALIGTWRAWQKTPNGPLYQAIKDGALDLGSLPAQRFQNWLKATFIEL